VANLFRANRKRIVEPVYRLTKRAAVNFNGDEALGANILAMEGSAGT